MSSCPTPDNRRAASQKRRVVIESPYAGNVTRNLAYARQCLQDSLKRGEAPFASHLLYTQVLDDLEPSEREEGISAGLAWSGIADATIVYIDHGISPGMQRGIDAAMKAGQPIEYRRIRQKAKKAAR